MATGRRSKTTRHRATPDALAKVVGARIRALRKERAFSFDAFVEETELGRGYISELERGLVVPSLTALAKVARALELTVADIVAGDSPRERIFLATRVLDEKEVSALLKHVMMLVGGRARG
jgi:transcriptional regulator with XRE-family HTH domain